MCIVRLSETGVADNPNMYGDLLLTPEQEKELLVNDGEAEEEGIKQGVKLWPKGQLVYELDSRLSKPGILNYTHIVEGCRTKNDHL